MDRSVSAVSKSGLLAVSSASRSPSLTRSRPLLATASFASILRTVVSSGVNCAISTLRIGGGGWLVRKVGERGVKGDDGIFHYGRQLLQMRIALFVRGIPRQLCCQVVGYERTQGGHAFGGGRAARQIIQHLHGQLFGFCRCWRAAFARFVSIWRGGTIENPPSTRGRGNLEVNRAERISIAFSGSAAKA